MYYSRYNGEVDRFNLVNLIYKQLHFRDSHGNPFTLQFLADYRSTPYAITGVPPSKLLHGRQMRTKLHILNLSDESENDLHEKVKMKQIKMKEYTDKRSNVFQTFNQAVK